jgi:tetratricopeptide (TPR) repeat protein
MVDFFASKVCSAHVQENNIDHDIADKPPEYITKVPIEVFNIIDDLAGNRGFLPSVSQLHVQNAPPFMEQAKAIADLADDKLQEFLDETSFGVTVDRRTMATLALQELASVYKNLGEVRKAKGLLSDKQNHLTLCKEELRSRFLKVQDQIKANSVCGFIKPALICNEIVPDLIYLVETYFLLQEFNKVQNILQQAEGLINLVPSTYHEMLQIDTFSSKCNSLIEIALVYFKTGKPEKGNKLLKQAGEILDEEVLYNRYFELKKMALVYLELGNMKEAERFLEKSKESYFRNKDTLMWTGNYCRHLADLSLIYIDLKKVDKAIGLLKETEKSLDDASIKRSCRSYWISPIALAYIKAKNLEEAERIANLIAHLTVRAIEGDRIRLAIFHAYMDANNIAEARRIVLTIETPKLKEKAFARLK